MITTVISAKALSEPAIKSLVSKKLDAINNLQMAVGKLDELIIYPLDYPSSINSLTRALSIANHAIFVLNDSVTALDAELALAVENSGLNSGFILCDGSSDLTTFEKFFSSYKIGKFKRVNLGERFDYPAERTAQPDFSYVSIDKHFIVKGIGNVLLGFTFGKNINKGDRLFLLPTLKEVTIKNIQIMDVNVADAGPGEHVGIALNNVNEDDLEANYAVSSSKDVNEEFVCGFTKSALYGSDQYGAKGLSCALFGKNLGLSLSMSGNATKIKFSKPVLKNSGPILTVDSSLAVRKNRIAGRVELL